ncbi:hypothetical protein BDW74DRAFT_86762 [Aspergillus multicolor]|uniref:uncharacterized protein n=1 Tax=Aspergillus multicolor TaxID=41759 RepID=UPI003CCE418D
MYQLTEQDLDDVVEDSNPAIRAAGNPNSEVLKALLAYYETRSKDPNLNRYEKNAIARCSPSATIAFYRRYWSPIKAAIRINSVENLRLLLDADAESNGILRWEISDYSVRYMRGRDYEDNFNGDGICQPRYLVLQSAKERGIIHPICPLTDAELDARRQCFPAFWSEPDIPGQALWSMRASTALEEAAMYGNTEAVDLLRAAGAEESAWVQSQSQESDEPDLWDFDEKAPVSALSTSSPVHEALTHGHQAMLRHLLWNCGYSPNYRPRAVPTMSLPPLSHILVRCDLNDKNVQNCLVDLLTNPHSDPNLRTPVFGVHTLHFAAAHHDPELLLWLAEYIPGGLATAGTTSLGHTLFHIACLPLHGFQINAQNTKVTTSIHCARTLDYYYKHPRLQIPRFLRFKKPRPPVPQGPTPLTPSQQQAQLATIRTMIQAQAQAETGFRLDIKAQDLDGNTALHYLAGTLNMVQETIDVVRGIEGGEEVWLEAKNRWGFTPSQLWA